MALNAEEKPVTGAACIGDSDYKSKLQQDGDIHRKYSQLASTTKYHTEIQSKLKKFSTEQSPVSELSEPCT